MAEIGEVHEIEDGIFEWTISDFFSVPDEVDELYFSRTFSFDGVQWCLAMYPNGPKKYQSEGYITVGLGRLSSGPPIELKFLLGLKTSMQEIAEERRGTYNFEKQYGNFLWISFLKRCELLERKSQLAPLDHVTFVCRLKHPPSTDTDSAIPTARCARCKDIVNLTSHERKCLEKPIRCPECSNVVALRDWYAHQCQRAKSKDKASGPAVKSKILQDLKKLFQNQENCDVVLKVEKLEFPAHRAILTARSSVFASTFRSDMKEKATGVVEIEDCEPSTFPDFLLYLYCEEVEALSEANVCSLFATADRYDVPDLRAKCIEFMKENLSVDTFCDTLALALQYSDTELIRFANDFFEANADEIIVTAAWRKFAAENPVESSELSKKFVASVKH